MKHIPCGGIAQLARALGSYPNGRWFKSDFRYHNGPLVKRLRHGPFTAVTWVRFPYGSPKKEKTWLWKELTQLWLPRVASGKEPTCQLRRCNRLEFNPWVRKIPWRRPQQLTPISLRGEFHGQRSLAGYSPWSCKESDTTE